MSKPTKRREPGVPCYQHDSYHAECSDCYHPNERAAMSKHKDESAVNAQYICESCGVDIISANISQEFTCHSCGYVNKSHPSLVERFVAPDRAEELARREAAKLVTFLYYAQKDGCPNGHVPGCGKICFGCVEEALVAALLRSQGESRWIRVLRAGMYGWEGTNCPRCGKPIRVQMGGGGKGHSHPMLFSHLENDSSQCPASPPVETTK